MKAIFAILVPTFLSAALPQSSSAERDPTREILAAASVTGGVAVQIGCDPSQVEELTQFPLQVGQIGHQRWRGSLAIHCCRSCCESENRVSCNQIGGQSLQFRVASEAGGTIGRTCRFCLRAMTLAGTSFPAYRSRHMG